MDSVDDQAEDATEWAIDNHPANEILDQFDPEFGVWVHQLEKSLLMMSGGCPFKKEDFSPVEWRAMGILKQWQEEKNNV